MFTSCQYFSPTPKADDPVVTVGGISEDFVKWSENKTYAEGSIIQFGNEYYVAKSQHVAGTDFDQSLYQKLPEIPMKGGRSAFFRREFNTELVKEPLELLYGTMFRTVQEVVDFLLGYSKYLESEGFTFNKFSEQILDVENWRVSAKEFLFWTTQGWAENSVITLSPGANELKFYKEKNVADNIFDTFYQYSLLKADGKKLIPEYVRVGRDNDNEFTISTRNTADGIYNVNIPVSYTHLTLPTNREV